jgi:hypothetical protein
VTDDSIFGLCEQKSAAASDQVTELDQILTGEPGMDRQHSRRAWLEDLAARTRPLRHPAR